MIDGNYVKCYGLYIRQKNKTNKEKDKLTIIVDNIGKVKTNQFKNHDIYDPFRYSNFLDHLPKDEA